MHLIRPDHPEDKMTRALLAFLVDQLGGSVTVSARDLLDDQLTNRLEIVEYRDPSRITIRLKDA